MGLAANYLRAMVWRMEQLHEHATAIDRVGREAIMAHFGISRQAIDYWRKNGVPPRHRKTLAMLGAVAGHDMKEVAA